MAWIDRSALRRAAILLALAAVSGASAAADSRDALFDDGAKEEGKAAWKGYAQFEAAYTDAEPEHWSKLRGRFELGRQGQVGAGLKWKVSARADYDAAYGVEDDFYPPAVRRDQRHEFMWRETYLDINAGSWDFRLGRQHVVWGEMVGLFFADVVSAKDLREYVLPEFEQLRIPQWAARAEYFQDDFHAELLWIPLPAVDDIGKPGAEFFPTPAPPPPGFGLAFRGEEKPDRKLSNSNWGARLTMLTGGWDLSAFYYRSVDAQATFFRSVDLAAPAIIYAPRHEKIHQAGATLAKDFGNFVLKAEAVYTRDRQYNVARLDEADGVVPLDTVDWVVGLDLNPGEDTRVNLQFFQRAFLDYDEDIIPDRNENGVTLLLNTKPVRDVEAQVLLIHSLNRSDWLLRPSLAWTLKRNWRLLVGADIFHGPALGLWGRFDDRDRGYAEVRYSF